MNPTISIFHVDDDALYIEQTEKVLRQCPELNYVGFATDAATALQQIKLLKPQVVLLDLEMPDKNGLWLAEQLKGSGALIVFSTNYPQYALQALDALCLHYLLKPITKQSVKKIVQKISAFKQSMLAQQSAQISEMGDAFSSPTTIPSRIFVNTQKQVLVLHLADITYISAEGSYTKFYLNDGKEILSAKGMKMYTSLVTRHPDFVKVHRSYIINQAQLLCIDKKKADVTFKFKNELFIKMANLKLSGSFLDA